MNTYAKYCPNVFCAKCTEPHLKGEEIILTTKHGKEHECIVFNHLLSKDGFHYYSIIRADGFNAQERAQNKADRLQSASENAAKKSTEYYEASQEGRDFLRLAEPIKVGHHSEKRHRALIERNHNRMRKCVEFSDKAESYEGRIEYWESRANKIDLSMPESLDFYAFKLEQAKAKHQGIKNGTIPKDHSMSLQYANKAVKDAENNLKLATKLWGD
jgi:hypothetical protein